MEKERLMKSLIRFTALVTLAAVGEAQEKKSSAPSTPMGRLAAEMKPGTWAELKTQGIVETLKATGVSGAIFGYSEGGAWDPVSRRFLYVGGDHNGVAQFVSYSADDNTWRVLPQPGWIGKSTMHGYDHNAVDPVHRVFYHFPFGDKSRIGRRYDLAKNEWSDLPKLDPQEYLACAVGVAYFPELEALVVANGGGGKGSVHAFRPKTGQWTTLAHDLPMGDYHNFAEYNPVRKVIVFGGGNGSPFLYKLDAAGTVTPLGKAPIGLGVMQSIVTVDPVGGDYLVFGKGGEFYSFDVAANRWKENKGTVPIFAPVRVPDNKIWHTNAAPVDTYGVTMFVKYYSAEPNSQAWVYLYKHSAAASKKTGE